MNIRLLPVPPAHKYCFLCSTDGGTSALCARHRALLCMRWIGFFVRHPSVLDVVWRRQRGLRLCYICRPDLDALDVESTTLCLHHQLTSRFLFYPMWRRQDGRWKAIRKLSYSLWRVVVSQRRYR